MSALKIAIDEIRAAVGDGGWVDDPDIVASHLEEQRGLYVGKAAGVARPATAQAVADVLAICNTHHISVVPQGGNTGLVGGGVPDGGIILSTERLNTVRGVDATNATMTVEAGCILANVQRAADDVGLLFPLSLAAEGTCQIGGNLATNAGGVQVLRYGNARDLVLGLEVALPDGRLWDGLRALRKDNTGYDLKHLFMGSEGTLGVITAAVLKLFPKPKTRVTVMAAMADVPAMVALFMQIQATFGDALSAFEMIARRGLEFTCKHIDGTRDPFDAPHAQYALIEVTSSRDDPNLYESLETALGKALDDGIIQDAVISASETQSNALWHIREHIPEAQKSEGGSIKHDVSVPLSAMADFIERATNAIEGELPGIRPCPFGHLGDGNIHFNLSQPIGMDKQAFLDLWHPFNRIVHDIVADLGGSFSAEHGIGQLKVDELRHYRSPLELEMMAAIKDAFDPQGIMNPGKVIGL